MECSVRQSKSWYYQLKSGSLKGEIRLHQNYIDFHQNIDNDDDCNEDLLSQASQNWTKKIQFIWPRTLNCATTTQAGTVHIHPHRQQDRTESTMFSYVGGWVSEPGADRSHWSHYNSDTQWSLIGSWLTHCLSALQPQKVFSCKSASGIYLFLSFHLDTPSTSIFVLLK